jgi:hypothetical protein
VVPQFFEPPQNGFAFRDYLKGPFFQMLVPFSFAEFQKLLNYFVFLNILVNGFSAQQVFPVLADDPVQHVLFVLLFHRPLREQKISKTALEFKFVFLFFYLQVRDFRLIV